MKKLILQLFIVAFSCQSLAAPAVQRTLGSSYQDYKTHLEKSGQSSFVDAYIQLAGVTELETPLLEKCLEELYLGAPATSTCLGAVKSLTSKPLNQKRREVLYSFLVKLEKRPSPQKSFYKELRSGLLRTHDQLTKAFGATAPEADESASDIQELEMKAWKKALSRGFPLEEVALLINGKRVSKLEKWTAPKGVYQWSLITNTHEPFVRLGTFSQFAAESLKELKPLATVSCPELGNLDVQKFGLLQIDVFSSPKCIAHFGISEPIGKLANAEHLGSSQSMVKMESSSNRHWIWPALVLVTVGIAASLKDKQVSVGLPGIH